MADTKVLTEHNSLAISDKRVRISSGHFSLVAKLMVLSPTAPLLILAHGFAGDMDEKGLFVGARDFFAGNGFSVLRFDFRGCGESDGDFRTVRLADLASDLQSVLRYARSCDDLRPTAIGVVCFSLAAGIAILANPGRVGGYAFWSPAVYTDRDMAPRYQAPDIADQIAQHGWFEKAGQRVGGLFLEDLGSDQIARAVACFRHPTLVVHGTADQRIPPASSEGLMRHLPAKSKLILMRGADHSFRSEPSHREWLYSATASWMSGRLKKAAVPPNQPHMFLSEENRNTDSTYQMKT